MKAVSVEVYNLSYTDIGLSNEAIDILGTFLPSISDLDCFEIDIQKLEWYLNHTGTGTYMVIAQCAIVGTIFYRSFQVIRSFVNTEFMTWIGEQGYILVDIYENQVSCIGYKYQRWIERWIHEPYDSNTLSTEELFKKYHEKQRN